MTEPTLCDRCDTEVATQGDVCDDCWQEYYATDLDDGERGGGGVSRVICDGKNFVAAPAGVVGMCTSCGYFFYEGMPKTHLTGCPRGEPR